MNLCVWLSVIMNSSGTSQGRPKFIPFTDELMENTLQLYRTAFAFRNRYTSKFSDYVPHINTHFTLFSVPPIQHEQRN